MRLLSQSGAAHSHQPRPGTAVRLAFLSLPLTPHSFALCPLCTSPPAACLCTRPRLVLFSYHPVLFSAALRCVYHIPSHACGSPLSGQRRSHPFARLRLCLPLSPVPPSSRPSSPSWPTWLWHMFPLLPRPAAPPPSRPILPVGQAQPAQCNATALSITRLALTCTFLLPSPTP